MNSINNLGYSLDNEYYDIQGAYGYNGIISSCQNESFINEFYSRFNKYCLENNIVTEFTRFNPILNNYQLSKKYMSVSFNRQTVFVDLTKDISHILSQFSSSTKRSIRKAEKNNLYCTVNGYKPTEEETFKKLYHSTMSRVGASPYLFFSEEYFNYK